MMERNSAWRGVTCLGIVGLVAATAFAAPPEDGNERRFLSIPPRQAVKKPAKPRSFLFFNPRKSSSPEVVEKRVVVADSTGDVPQRPVEPGHVSIQATASTEPQPASSVRQPTASQSSQISWQTDLKRAHRLSATSKKPMLLVFGATWCQSCLRMEREVLRRPEIADQVMSSFIPVHIDADQNQKLIELLEVESVPAVIVLNQDFEVLKRLDGYQSANKLASALGSVTAQMKPQAVNLEE
jgi:thioredoxin-related protein